MEPSLAWGVAWGDSWGWSWGPLHEVEEDPARYNGSGKSLPVPADWNTRESSEDEIIRKVLDKWEFIESIQRDDSEKPAPADPTPIAAAFQVDIPDAVDIGTLTNLIPLEISLADNAEALRLSAQRIHNEQAIALILAEL